MTRAKLMIPGPVDVSEAVRQAMAVPSMPHYGPEWMQLYGEVQEMAKQVFGTRHDLYMLAGPGTMALEAALSSALEPGEQLMMLTNGFFGDRLITVAEACALAPVVVRAELGEPLTPELTAAALDAQPQVKALVVVHHETSTGVLNPLEGIAAVTRERDIPIIVDAVSSLGGVPLPVDDWGIDFCVTVANKTLETPPALALLSLSPRGAEMITRRQSPRGWYLDLKTWRWYAENWGDWHPTPVTMPTSNLYALHHSLSALLTEGIERRYAAYAAAARATRQGLRALGFPMFVESEQYASPLTTAFRMPAGLNADALKQRLLDDAGVMISGGIGALRGQILRVGHIGQARKRDYVVAFLLGLENALRAEGVAVSPGQSLLALERLEI